MGVTAAAPPAAGDGFPRVLGRRDPSRPPGRRPFAVAIPRERGGSQLQISRLARNTNRNRRQSAVAEVLLARL